MATIEVGRPDVGRLGETVSVLREWQSDAAPMQLHPGDLGWYWQFGGEATAAAVRIWRRDGQIAAVGLLDGPELFGPTSAPDAMQDEDLVQHIVDDVSKPEPGVLPDGKVTVEAPVRALIMDLLTAVGWKTGDPWTSLGRDLTEPVEGCGLYAERQRRRRRDLPVGRLPGTCVEARPLPGRLATC